MKKMLINATQAEEVRVALVDGQRLYDLDIENRSRVATKANVYKAKVTRVEPSLEAAFVDFGADRHGFLPLKEIAHQYYRTNAPSGEGRVKIRDVLKEGTELLVQVDKEERGSKGAALTSFISLAGRYMVLMPNNPKAGGISRRIEGDDRSELRDALAELNIPDGMGVIIRTAGVGRSSEELQWDLDYLLQLWDAIETAANDNKSPVLLYQESDVIIRSIRDYLRDDVDQVLIDDPVAYKQASDFVSMVMPKYSQRIKFYEDPIPLFNRFQVEGQIETAFSREVRLPSGGSIVIDPTEALVSIDINSARATKGSDIEQTALNTNLEAAEEIARQLRLRDMGGLIVIDFIDMNASKNQRAVENRIRDALEIDRARVQVGRISRFGLLEMSRQRLRPSLGETSGMVCPRCTGQGTIRDTKSLGLAILRLMLEEATKEKTAEVRAIVPVDVAAFLLNEKRAAVNDIEAQSSVRLLIIPNPHMETPHFELVRLREDEVEEEETHSFDVEIETPPPMAVQEEENTAAIAPQALVRGVTPSQPAPAQVAPAVAEAPAAPVAAPTPAAAPSKPGLVSKFLSTLFAPAPAPEDTSSATEEEAASTTERENTESSDDQGRSRDGQRRSRGGRNRRRGGKRSDSEQASESQDASEAEDEASASASDTDTDDQEQDDKPKRSRRRRGRRGGQRRNNGDENGNVSEDTGVTADEDAEDDAVAATVDTPDSDADETTSDTSEARHRPQEMRREGRRRRRRGPKPEVDAAAAVAEDTNESADATVEPTQAAEVDADKPSTEPVPAAASESENETAEVESSATVADQQPQEAPAETVAEEPVAAPEAAEEQPKPVAKKTAVPTPQPAPSEADAAPASRAGLTEKGRAINDPRVAPKPVAEVSVETAHTSLFAAPEAPPVSVISQDVPRASNDPRLKREAQSDAAPSGQDSGTQDLFAEEANG
ncbi:ribonuclease E [Luminiphilus syltensis NOR5-1B]|uniref:Ribonuclease E n=1 Tax=Luminiphilus syltensis NOR5-1B TaxID=565045 RepID=B8KQV5_9GAMM|nr:ribonuclease E [Luminiphilus syltensis]EED35890.1 ribonuclease E [Luminiphilus syltensis NOR5-1B]